MFLGQSVSGSPKETRFHIPCQMRVDGTRVLAEDLGIIWQSWWITTILEAHPMDVSTQETLWSAVADVGIKRGLVIAGGSALVLVGLIGLALYLAATRQADAAGARPRRRLLVVGSVLLTAIGALLVLAVGIIIPLGPLRLNNLLLESRLAILHEELLSQGISAKLSLNAQSEHIVREILSRPRYRDPKRLNRYELKICSQNGEDGIIAEMFRRIGTANRYFVEFGSSDGFENNTALLLRQGWSGLWIDADTAAVNRAKASFASEIAAGKLTVLEAFITAENIEDLFREARVPEEFDLLSIDINRNDYYVWEKITHFRPRVAIVEYNSGVPPSMSWVVAYDPKAFASSIFGTGNGASLKVLEELGAKKGYSLVGCNLLGVNSFFARNDLVGDHFAAPYTAENHFEPFRWDYIRMPRCDPRIGDDQEHDHPAPGR